MIRTCVGCHAAEAPDALVRLVLGPDGSLFADPRGGSIGRGAWVHVRSDCVVRGVPRGVARALKATVRATPDEVALALAAAGKRRLLALLGQAFSARKAAAGATAVSEAWEGGGVKLVIVASDARAAAHLAIVDAAQGKGRALVAGTKAEIGRALGRPETGVVAILDEGLAQAIRSAQALADFVLARSPRRTGDETRTVRS
jgi:predicted RNA-binding protein YlxR (DUF448 family)/ribosomal protein L30E